MSSPTQQLAQAPNVGQVAHELETGLTDALHLPGDAEYERQRDSFHGAPDAVVDTETVARRPATVRVARRHGLPLTVLSTGHGTVVAPDGGILLRTSEGRAPRPARPDDVILHHAPHGRPGSPAAVVRVTVAQ
jgi:hypothetical protein